MALSPIFQLADDHISELAALDPIAATGLGVPGYDHQLTDFSPDGHRARADLVRRTRDAVRTAPRTDDHDRLAADVIDDLLDTALEAFDAGEWTYALRTLASPVSGIRSVFDLMPRQGTEAWDAIAARLHAVPAALDGVRATFDHGLATGHVAARRQALATAAQCTTWAETRWFDTLTGEARVADGLPAALVERVAAGADAAIAAYGSFAGYLRDDYTPHATETDACGPARYAVNARAMLGARLDPGEMYDWAWTDFHELRSDMRRTCEQILPGAGFGEVRELLDTDPARALHSAEAYQAWLQDVTDTAIERSLALFDVPEPMRHCEARIPPAGSAAAPYYTPPSEDFSRPASTWYPLLGRSSFPMWGDVTTCYHESVPGHHLQIGYTLTRASTLSRIQRTSFVSGHGEGWALYAERLADELGWFENADQRLGFLAGQMLRTVRVIVDIGMHLGVRIPEGTTLTDGTPFHGGEVWTPALAYEFAVSETGQGETFLASEIDRYLGWPAQAISYKIGEREWLAARDDARRRLGAAFDLRAFHTFALGLGPLGLAQLRSELQHHAV